MAIDSFRSVHYHAHSQRHSCCCCFCPLRANLIIISTIYCPWWFSREIYSARQVSLWPFSTVIRISIGICPMMIGIRIRDSTAIQSAIMSPFRGYLCPTNQLNNQWKSNLLIRADHALSLMVIFRGSSRKLTSSWENPQTHLCARPTTLYSACALVYRLVRSILRCPPAGQVHSSSSGEVVHGIGSGQDGLWLRTAVASHTGWVGSLSPAEEDSLYMAKLPLKCICYVTRVNSFWKYRHISRCLLLSFGLSPCDEAWPLVLLVPVLMMPAKHMM